MVRRERAKDYARPADETLAAARAALEGMGAQLAVQDPAPGTLKAVTSVSLMSWGEAMLVRVEASGAGTRVVAESKTRFPLTLIDWGKNNRNLDRLLAALDATLA